MIGDNWPDAEDIVYTICGKPSISKMKRLMTHPEKHYVREISAEGWVSVRIEYMIGGYYHADGSSATVTETLFCLHPNDPQFNVKVRRAIKDYYGLCKEIFEAEEHTLNVMFDWSLTE
jgi:hypothetical protein